ncbi:MAG: galactokinase [Candidatus Thorarchaeota archaeon]|nr:galactokinase [Candidatus Thorarchaeota archaeon]
MWIPQKLREKMVDVLGDPKPSPVVVRAPGRIEVLGNHTDYNGGEVLAATIDRYVWSIGIRSQDVEIHSVDLEEIVRFQTSNIAPPKNLTWDSYAKGIYWALERRKHQVSGITAIIHGNIPQGAGLSSSAAFEVSLVNLVLGVSGIELNPKSIAMLAFEAERIYCGVACGVMDQFTAQLGKPNHLLAIRCSNMVTGDIPWDSRLKLVVVESGVSRAAKDVLNQRRHECQQALHELIEAGWEISSLSEIQSDRLHLVDELLGSVLARRVKHIVLENQRVRRGVQALREGRIEDFGKEMFESHASSRNLYEVSHPKLDILVDLARNMKGVIGSRMTGAGLGGATLTVVEDKFSQSFIQSIGHEYESTTGTTPRIMETGIPGGVVTDHI